MHHIHILNPNIKKWDYDEEDFKIYKKKKKKKKKKIIYLYNMVYGGWGRGVGCNAIIGDLLP